MTQIIKVKNIISFTDGKRVRKKFVTRIRKRDRMDHKLTEIVPLSQVSGKVFTANLPVGKDGELDWTKAE
tara:strand:- start:348 stop:557 length:210 start_codon:yes stop_codon:yes gene_type:complete